MRFLASRPAMLCRRDAVKLFVAVGAGACAMPAHAKDYKESGKVKIEQVQIAFIGSGNLGGGTLTYRAMP